MFTHGLKALEYILPSLYALFQHTKRTLLVAAFIWMQLLYRSPHIPNAGEWCWELRLGMECKNKYTCIGLIYQMPAKGAHCYFTLGAWLHARTTTNAIEFAVHCTTNDMTI
jgi:hypothetical protein